MAYRTTRTHPRLAECRIRRYAVALAVLAWLAGAPVLAQTGLAQVDRVIGEPVSLADARTLAAADPYQFQWWALGLVHARPTEQKKGADKGIDGRLYFHEGDTSQTKQIVISVKAGKLHAPYVRDLRGVMEREQAEMSVLLSLEEPTAKMRTEAASAGFYASAWGKHPRLQIVTVGELLDGQKLDAPPPRQTSVTFKRAPRAKTKTAKSLDLDLGKD